MQQILINQNISLSQIDFNDFTYSISPTQETASNETLKKSISRHGILHPPILREVSQERYTIIAGRKRLLALRSLQKENTCTCLVICRQVPEIEVFDIMLEEIQLFRQLTIVEKALFLKKIKPIAVESSLIKEFMVRLDLAPDSSILKQTLKLLELEGSILSGLHQQYVNEAVAGDLVSLSAQDRTIMFEIIASLRPSFSNQKKLVAICRELAARENKGIAALLDNQEAHDILQHREANPPQKIKKLMTWLSRRQKPRSNQAEEEFSRFKNAMRLSQNVTVTHTPFFENDAVTLSITFHNREALQKAWEKIKDGTDNKIN